MNTQQQITKALLEFYNRPIGQVSAELFLSIGAVIFFTIFAIQPTLATMSDLIKEIEDKQQLDQQLTQKIAALSTVQSTYLQIENQVPLLYEAIPLQPNLIESLLVIEKVASERNLVIENITVRQVPEEISVDIASSTTDRLSIPISISMTGTYLNIAGYLEELMNLRRLIIVESIAFSRTEERGIESLRANITLSLPYYGTRTTRSRSDAERTPATPEVLQDVEL